MNNYLIKLIIQHLSESMNNLSALNGLNQLNVPCFI